MPKLTTVALAIALLFAAPSLASAKLDSSAERAAIKSVIASAYVNGVHRKQDVELMRAGFNSAFIMFINGKEGVRHFSIDDWMARTKPPPAGTRKAKVKSDISILDLTETAAVARVKLWKDGKLTFTDYMSMYKKDGKWTIVGKVFHRH